jgi:DNA-binding MarR family transcriptional regulator
MAECFEDHLSSWIHRAAHAFRTALESQSPEWGLHWGEAAVLFKLEHYGPQSLAELSRKMGHSHPTVLAQVKNLEQAGYLTRSPHPEDRRVRIIALTASGKQMVSRFGQLADEINRRVLAQFGADRSTRVIADLQSLIEILSTFPFSAKVNVESHKTTGAVKPSRARSHLRRG